MNAVDRRKFLSPVENRVENCSSNREGKEGNLDSFFAFTIPIKNSSVCNRIKRYTSTSETAVVLTSTTSLPYKRLMMSRAYGTVNFDLGQAN
jgi:hypothetical protein